MKQNQSTSITQRIVLSLLVIAICFLAGEVILRLFAPFPDYSYEIIHSFPDQYDPILGYSGIPNLDQMFTLPDFKVRIKTNSRGFRDRERSYPRGGEKRIVILGDSHAWGWGVENDQIFSAIMERRLKGWEVINLGQAGYSTDQELVLLEREGLRYRPDLVVLLFCENDVKDAHSNQIDGMQPKPYFAEEEDEMILKNVPVPYNTAYWKKKRQLSQTFAPDRGVLGKPIWGDRFEKVLRKSHFINWLRFRLSQFRKPQEKPQPEPPEEKLRKKLALNLKLIRRMDALCREKGARLIVVDIPSVYSPLLKGFCRNKAIPYLDLGDSLKQRFTPTNFRRVGHWTRYGQRRVADALLAFLKKEKLLAEGQK